MDNVFKGLNKVFCYIDDILIGDGSIQGLHDKLISVLEKLREYNIKVNWQKCKFFVEKVTYLGHEVSVDGIAPSKEKILAISSAPEPQNVAQLQSFIGLINYYSKFIPHLNQHLSVFFELTRKGAKWSWTTECKRVFDICKKEISNGRILEHFDAKKTNNYTL